MSKNIFILVDKKTKKIAKLGVVLPIYFNLKIAKETVKSFDKLEVKKIKSSELYKLIF